ncbi:phosphomannomutase [Ketogulonicigenium vulgare]|uniref:Phosphoglucomutase/phosphomannomutase alpha/beta/alpha domain I n=1 Tax=Ketogulonicigenium vulgare (strain WSH-001) TaxID=759362 RepID=F9Y722_KETVW|nr:phosphomannomutase [Ketogulonicigenium vulgare]ADO41215.1 phosphomannomutase [Ketogulonicigenium vulgare Y25]AEM42212.1 Phosphoglucomutase/phosphomannomutase alpha/beta/alpha domain I [Ketogulonicigenium vulgare WSH-001]ALJ79835.1 phosphomannomutase [Ketogulonicigenium vulgare]ANW32745.1 phosphomannomutase [Ketogulonicigenium vulgare]AOZ53045.1 phosphomannomutase [Ketogulonicigenium vulgare]
MVPKFGTSGLRGRADALTADCITAYIQAFVAACPIGNGVFVARDLRESAPRIAKDVIAALRQTGITVTDCGCAMTPALALASSRAGAAAIMVTGSHIPAAYNGLKFYTPMGEITKIDEAAILAALGGPAITRPLGPLRYTDISAAYRTRYTTAFGTAALVGRRVGVWSHSAVGRDDLIAILRALGAEVVEFGRADHFIAVDTEAVTDTTRARLRAAARMYRLDAILSMDGDGDRPLMTDAGGTLIAGDILGQITARALGATSVVTPISSNTGVEALDLHVLRTRIGSPYVIAGMQAQPRAIGYEANGGVLLGYDAQCAGPLPALMTRDSLLPMLVALIAAAGGTLAARVRAEPARFTASGLLPDIDPCAAQRLIADLQADSRAFLAPFGLEPAYINRMDGLRITALCGQILHIRPSGNAPELRLYTEAASPRSAARLLKAGLQHLKARLVQQVVIGVADL